MLALLGPHPRTFAFYSDLAWANVILAVLVFLFFEMVGQKVSNDDVRNATSVMLPLSIVFAGLTIALSMQMAAMRLGPP